MNLKKMEIVSQKHKSTVFYKISHQINGQIIKVLLRFQFTLNLIIK